MYLTDKQYIEVLNRLRGRILDNLPLVADDCMVPGMKDTSCSWGLCSKDKETWLLPEEHIWPNQFLRGRIAPKYRENHQLCPMDTREPGDEVLRGCFFTCMVFKAKNKTLPAKEQTIRLFDKRIRQALERK